MDYRIFRRMYTGDRHTSITNRHTAAGRQMKARHSENEKRATAWRSKRHIDSSSLRIVLLLLGVSLFALSCSDDGGPVDPDPQPELTEIEARVLLLINQHRSEKGLAVFQQADIITREARKHSANMADGTVSFGHGGFEQRYQTIAQNIPLSAAAENVANNYGFPDPAGQAVSGWLGSPRHRDNIEGDFDLTGIGVSRNPSGTLYFTHIFIKSR
jgi:uncharacterized protein YkwD